MRHISTLNVSYKLLKKLAYLFNLYKSTLDTQYSVIYITLDKIRDAHGLNAYGENPFCNLICKSNFGIFYIISVLLKYFCCCYKRVLSKQNCK
ncbi:hypothetical protein AHAS_Ahas18G0248800 [Arachis hypogaea]